MSKSFSAQIDDWVRKSENRMEAVFKTAAQDLSIAVTTPKSRGGRMPVDTGFLINSIMAGINQTPSGPSVRTTEPERDDYVMGNSIAVEINSAKVGDKIVFGFTAAYAPYMEYQNGFVRLNAQQWPEIVDNSMRKVRAAFP